MRRLFLTRLAQLAALPLVVAGGAFQGQTAHKPLKILMKSAWGSDDPTKAAFPFSHGLALAEAGHTVQVYLLWRSGGAYAKNSGQLGHASRMATGRRNFG